MKILCFGDSNTWGHNPIDGSRLEKPWPRLLSEMFPECKIIEDGVCGRTTAYDIPGDDGKNGLTSFKEYTENGNGADILILMLGTNDTLNAVDKSAKESAHSIREYVHLWKTAFPESDILIISPIHITNYALKHEVFSQLYSHNSILNSHSFAAEYVRIAKEEGVYFRDAALYAEPSAVDGIHLSPEGHEKLARLVCGAIRGII